jgi:methionyl-tRNA synthetase
MNGTLSPLYFAGLTALVIWSAIWKGIALWKSGRNNQKIWFIVMFVINSAGLLPILYILLFQKKKH